MKTKHTPGPWKYFNGTIIGHSEKAVIKNEYYFDWVASLQVSNVPEWEANAKLIAAAPELLEACEKALYYMQKTNIVGPTANLLKEAIKKATE